MNDLDVGRARVPGQPADVVLAPAPYGHPAGGLAVAIDEAELARRSQWGERLAVTDPAQLDLLMEMPAGERISVDSLTKEQTRALRRMPRHAVHLAGPTYSRPTHATRLAQRPARVHLALVRGGTSARAMGAVTSYAPFCTRALVLDKPPARPDFLTEAGFWGVGVALLHAAGDVEVLVRPEPWRLQRHSVAGWRFAEQAFLLAVRSRMVAHAAAYVSPED
jgi:hypothetical protein